MKWFALHPGGNREGALFDDDATPRRAVFLTPGQAKFMVVFRGVREAQSK